MRPKKIAEMQTFLAVVTRVYKTLHAYCAYVGSALELRNKIYRKHSGGNV